MFKQLQEEHKVWAEKNFGNQDIEVYCLGLIEEIGELAHSVLKRKQGIKNNENHDEKIKDAIGDITIYLVGFCNCSDINIEELYLKRNTINYSNINTIDCLKLLSMSISLLVARNVSFQTSSKAIICVLFERLVFFCNNERFNFEAAVLNTWKEVVSQRDWKNNPDCISTKEVIDSKIHLCNKCENEIPTCKSGKVVFGNGKGDDNIIECEGFKIKLDHLCKTCYHGDTACLGAIEIMSSGKSFNSAEGVQECNYYIKIKSKCVTDDLRFQGFPV